MRRVTKYIKYRVVKLKYIENDEQKEVRLKRRGLSASKTSMFPFPRLSVAVMSNEMGAKKKRTEERRRESVVNARKYVFFTHLPVLWNENEMQTRAKKKTPSRVINVKVLYFFASPPTRNGSRRLAPTLFRSFFSLLSGKRVMDGFVRSTVQIFRR